MDGRTGYIICAQCGTVGHTMGKCPDRPTAATSTWAGPRVADVPRRCTCGAATTHTVDGQILGLHGGAHRCGAAAVAA